MKRHILRSWNIRGHGGDNADALRYELEDFEAAVRNEDNSLHLDYTIDVMELMTKARREWGMTYPEEE